MCASACRSSAAPIPRPWCVGSTPMKTRCQCGSAGCDSVICSITTGAADSAGSRRVSPSNASSASPSGTTPGGSHNDPPRKSPVTCAVLFSNARPPKARTKAGKLRRYSCGSGHNQRMAGSEVNAVSWMLTARGASAPSTMRISGSRMSFSLGSYARSDPPLAPLPVRRADLALQELAGGITRDLGDEVDGARALVVGETLAAEIDDVVRGRVRAVFQLHDGLQLLAPLLVRDADHRDVEHRGVLVDDLLDLRGIDVDAAGDHHVGLAVDDVEVVVLVEIAHVADGHVLAAERFLRLLGILVVLHRAHERIRDVDAADLAPRERRPVVVEDENVGAGDDL